ncbi:hypothetical protein AO268_23515 [Pseudomonas sp. ICMP 8385]|uniref:hypothetical protein n=1 Tax=Pseudomonas sp. ICMP 8385 TaxID=1718920 RepID=UPI000C07E087|nr:hypothetical protein [Pseudomonas sp. ICMP 8385]PHN53935.1 hypothetical protein AO268_23515 [Pseudomonas sp. ICMP 8385]
MATLEMPVWQMISIAVTILGAFVGVMKMLLVQMERRLDQRFAVVDKDSERLREMEIGMERLRGEMPLHYVRREDWARNQSIIEAKLYGLALKLENVQLKGLRP